MPFIPYASFLAGAILSLVMPVALLIAITAYFHFARKRLPEPSTPAVVALDPGHGTPPAGSREAPRTSPSPSPSNPVSGGSEGAAGAPPAGGQPSA